MRDAVGGDLDRLKGVRVLLAEDNVTNQMVATQMLDALGARVEVAEDGAEALEMIEADPTYDIYLLDIEMPRVSGLEVIRAIRAGEPALAGRPVIALTAYALREHREKIAEAGADGLIPKPIVGIEQFGRDILAHVDAAERRRDGAPARKVGPIDGGVYDGLAMAIGADAMAGLVEKVREDLERSRDELAAGAASGDLEAVRSATHVLISVAGAVGGKIVQTLSQRLNGVAHGREDRPLPDLAERTVAAIDELRAALADRAGVGEGGPARS